MSFTIRAALEQFTLPHPDDERRLTISVAEPPPSEGLAHVLYVVDGDMLFALAAEIARFLSAAEGLPPLYVVGVGYDAEYNDFMRLRTADLTPPIGADALNDMGGLGALIGAERNGGADAFLAFLTGPVRSQILARYPRTEAGDQILFGHSLGGLFGAHALLKQPDAFNGFILSSPYVAWDGFAILQAVPAFGERLAALPRQPRVFVDVGAHEQDIPTHIPDHLPVTLEEVRAQVRAQRMVEAARELVEGLRQAGLRDLAHVEFTEDDHMSVVPSAITHGLRFALGQVAGVNQIGAAD